MSRIVSHTIWKISLVLLCLLLALGGLQAWRYAQFLERASDETRQMLNWGLAQKLADRLRPELQGEINHSQLEESLYKLKVLYEEFEFYLLNEHGEIKAALGQNTELKRAKVTMEPLISFQQPDRILHLPIYADDPRSEELQKVFSVAPLQFGEAPGFLYIVLASELDAGLTKRLQLDYTAVSALTDLLLMTTITGIVGMALFFVITKRFRRLTAGVEQFSRGDLRHRIEIASNDEVGALSKTFNDMADTIEEYIDKLRSTDEQRRDLVVNISHDLRSPLTSITGYLETIIMKDDTLAPERRRRYLEIALESAHTLQQLIDDLFELSKLEAKETQPIKTTFLAEEFIQSLILRFSPQAADCGVRIECMLPDMSLTIHADINLLERVVGNLLGNALRYTPRDGTVTLAALTQGSGVLISVSDTGCGIPPEDLPYIFDRFYRVEKDRSAKTGGTGLGLAIVKKVVELHSGTIEVQSTLGSGTSFKLSIPGHTQAAGVQAAT